MKLLLVALSLLWPAAMWSQQRGFFAWWDSPVARDMGLRDDQRRQIRHIVRDYRGRLSELRSSVERAEDEVEEVFNSESADDRRAQEAIDRLANSRAELTRVLTQMSWKLRGVLTAVQWQELQKRRPRGGPNAPAKALRRP